MREQAKTDEPHTRHADSNLGQVTLQVRIKNQSFPRVPDHLMISIDRIVRVSINLPR